MPLNGFGALPLVYISTTPRYNLIGCTAKARTWKMSGSKPLVLPFHHGAIMVVRVGIEPTTPGFSVLCSTNWAIRPLLKDWLFLTFD